MTATLTNGHGAGTASAATLTLTDDETLPTVAFALSATSISENGGVATVAVTSRDASEGTVSPPSLTFATGNWGTAQTVTVTRVSDTIDDGTVTWQVRLDPSSGDSDYNAVTAVDVTTTARPG